MKVLGGARKKIIQGEGNPDPERQMWYVSAYAS